eukprot:CAMPEP_0195016778 /NCGR_PEP_ID=MMETSP0326_2-20130528/25427_1 /TAXON_ID=2866 ORGANISM="Crypthecodinium cohnii, Strain Seligo" /NCGR_SAMPLE_ID=MMETSP0326_2 /ASSEMBLY_ACC=CAM_ASM_000348 /LENGTH=97 /DNA_ID=CAMNT_0040032713 /DNA_START=137 /DNA_END=427 /DNA_ORIENTATION=-
MNVCREMTKNQFLSGVEHADVAVGASRQDLAQWTGGVDRDAVHTLAASVDAAKEHATVQVPESHVAIGRANHDDSAGRVDGQGEDGASVVLDEEELL